VNRGDDLIAGKASIRSDRKLVVLRARLRV
jgi:hypothetical protein